MGHRWRVLTDKRPGEAGGAERLPDATRERGAERDCEVHVTRSYRLMTEGVGQRMQPMQTVGPAAGDDQVAEAGPKRVDEPAEGGSVLHVTPARQ